MPRKSLAETYYEETEEREDEAGEIYLVIYDFSFKPNPRFWANLNRLKSLLGDASLIQYSVFKTGKVRGAMTAVKLARHYGAQVMVFKGEPLDIDQEQDSHMLN